MEHRHSSLESNTLFWCLRHTSCSVTRAFACELYDIFITELYVTLYALLWRLDEGICACFADNMPARLHHWHTTHVLAQFNVQAGKDLQNINMLFEKAFLHDGHMGVFSRSDVDLLSSLPASDASVDPSGRAAGREDISNMKLTGMRLFRLWGKY